MEVFDHYYPSAWMIHRVANDYAKFSELGNIDPAAPRDMIMTMFERYTKYHQRRALMIISIMYPAMYDCAFEHETRDPKAEEKVACLRLKMLIQQGEQQLKDNRKKHTELIAAIKRCDTRQKYLKQCEKALNPPTSSAPQPISHN